MPVASSESFEWATGIESALLEFVRWRCQP